jgi:hypothetical protein
MPRRTDWCWRCGWLSGVSRLIRGANCVGGQSPACHCGRIGFVSRPGRVRFLADGVSVNQVAFEHFGTPPSPSGRAV